MATAAKSNMAAADTDDKLFSSSIPKQEIGALRLLEKHPEFDGRGSVICIFDTGVDPGAAGLAVTSDGKPKVVDLQDCTGSGDVAMGDPVDIGSDGDTLEGANGVLLKINPSWKNPTGKWRVGAKPLFELYPGGCTKFVKKHRKEKVWKEQQDTAVAKALSDAAAVKDPKSDAAKELQARAKLLEEHAEKYSDAGPILHCVVWHDGDCWRAALDTQELTKSADEASGALAEFTPMTNFRKERQWGTFTQLDGCNYAVNIFDEGATLSIVTDVGSHGTHVAGISAACMRHDETEGSNVAPFDGVAPGAQIVSCKIGDNRVEGMETGPGLVRALQAAVDNGCDVINMSYGEATMTPDSGRFVDLANEVVRDKGVIFVASAGNNGPGLTTVGAPGGTSSCIISVGALVSPASAAVVHSHDIDSFPDDWEGQQYNWSSRGPTADGETGVSICAPGGAIAPVPQWCQQRRQLMNGTSMSSPCAAGGVALVVSGLKQLGLQVTPARVRRAIENTAVPVGSTPEDTLAHGQGLMQVDAALEYLVKSADSGTPKGLDDPDRFIEVSVKRSEGIAGGRGIYLRDAAATSAPSSFAVNFTPQLHRDSSVEQKLEVEERLVLECTAAWVTAPKVLLLPHNGRGIDVRVDPSDLPPGVHYAEVQAFDMEHKWRGPVARVPVTVCKPLPSREPWVETSGSAEGLAYDFPTMSFTPGSEHRHFFHPPPGTSWAELTLRTGAHPTPKLFMIHSTQLLPHTRPVQSRQALTLGSEAETTVAFSVAPGAGLEVALAQFWRTEGNSEINASLTFHGIGPAAIRRIVLGHEHVVKTMFHAALRRTKVNPKATLDTLVIPLRPSEHSLTPQTDPRDGLQHGKVMNRLTLTYKLSLAEGGTITPVLPPLQAAVYDGALEGQLYAVYNASKKQVSFGDVYPKSVTLGKGDYTIKVALRHDSVDVLQGLQALPLSVERKVDPAITMPCYSSLKKALSKAKTMNTQTLRHGDRIPVFLGPVPEDKFPKDAKPGTMLKGTLKMAQTSPAAGDKAAPGGCPVVFTVPPAAKKDDAGDDDEKPPEEKDPVKKMRKAHQDAQVKVLKDLKVSSEEERAAYNALAAELSAAYPDVLAIAVDAVKRAGSRLPTAFGTPVKPAGAEKEATAEGDKVEAAEPSVADLCQDAVAAADVVIKRIDQVAVAQFIAFKSKPETPEEKTHRATMKEQKGALIEALHTKCKANAAMHEADVKAQGVPVPTDAVAGAPVASSENFKKFEESYKELSKWVDVTAVDYVGLHASYEVAKGRPANAIKALDKILNDKDKVAGMELWQQKLSLLEALGWSHWAARMHEQMVQAFPKDFAAL